MTTMLDIIITILNHIEACVSKQMVEAAVDRCKKAIDIFEDDVTDKTFDMVIAIAYGNIAEYYSIQEKYNGKIFLGLDLCSKKCASCGVPWFWHWI